jgi:hypothetical protein
MQGRRLEDGTKLLAMQPGDYALSKDGREIDFCDPFGNFGGISKDKRWDWIEYEDKTVTVRSSIRVTSQKSWHGYLERGVWRTLPS